MLELRGIKKDYSAGSNTVHALKGIDLCFRKSEFVSILGPSGCGKTTMLNIIGGLDQYTEGDLLIKGTSTKKFKDRDWDNYRNHSIGFVFQSYNLIPHQTILQNVELALTLSGVSKRERRKRAKEVLEQVGLSDQLNKRPNTLSGGQMQRVAIARALVNNPDIILADEPTGALDSKTSVQVMELLKEVAKDRLVIMVTHNPELAEKYSTRIIRMLDGLITDDSMPLKEVEPEPEQPPVSRKKAKKASMSFFTAFKLSLRNLFTKKGRTVLTAFAGSIGIIGIALIFAISQGMTDYINTVQEETLTSYPLSINRTTIDLTSLLTSVMNVTNDGGDHDNDAVYRKEAMYQMMQSLQNVNEEENNLTAFKAFLESEIAKPEEDGTLSKAITGLSYSYDLGLCVYTRDDNGEIIPSDSGQLVQELIIEFMRNNMSSASDMSGSLGSSTFGMPGASMGSGVWQEMLAGKDGSLVNDVLQKQYDVIYGSWPASYDQVVLVVDENNELSDITLYALGLVTHEEMSDVLKDVTAGELGDRETARWDYEDICSREFRVVLNSDCYVYDAQTGYYSDLRKTDAGVRYLYDNAIPIKVVGIIRANEDATSSMLSSGIAYTSALTKYVLEESAKSDAIRAQMDDHSTDVITGLPFSDNTGNLSDSEKASAFKAYIADLDTARKAAAYVTIKSIPPDEVLAAAVEQAMADMDREAMENTLLSVLSEQMGMDSETISEYIQSMEDSELTDIMKELVAEGVKMQYAQQVLAQMAAMGEEDLAFALESELDGYTDKQYSEYYDAVVEFSDSTYEDNLIELGYVDLDSPATINIYASSFENKDIIVDAISDYNASKDEDDQIKYTDYMRLLMSSITVIINAISYVLIAFVAISLIVSSIMIGVITLISVQERTKEIGILRAIGASKHNVSNMFNAETVIIGFTAGLFGVVISSLLCIPINAIIRTLTKIQNISAHLPILVAVILVVISILLTLIAGIIPSRSAAKKDPVVALRTE